MRFVVGLEKLLHKRQSYPYVLCVLNGIIKEIYQVVGEWKPDHRYAENRYKFEAKVADEAVGNLFVAKRIPKNTAK